MKSLTRNLESMAWNLQSQTVLDSFIWGDSDPLESAFFQMRSSYWTVHCLFYSAALRNSAIWKKMPHRIYFAASNRVKKKKNRPKEIWKHHWHQHWFDGRSINLLWTFIASYCLNCLSLCLSHYFTRLVNIWDSPVIWAQAFSVA